MKINVEQVRLINEYQESGRVFFHMTDGTTIIRTMTSREVYNAQRIRSKQGEAAFKAEMVRLFNEIYSEPQHLKKVQMSPAEERFFELKNYRRTNPLPPDMEAEYQRLLNMDDYEAEMIYGSHE